MKVANEIQQLYNIDLLKLTYKVNKHDIEKLKTSTTYTINNYSLIELIGNKRDIINNNAYKRVWVSDHFYIATENRFMNDNESNDKLMIQFKNKTLYTVNFIIILKELVQHFKSLRFESIKMDIAMDTSTNIYDLFEDYRANPDYSFDKKIKTKKSIQELYDEIIIGSQANYFFRLYNKSKEIKNSDKYYIKQIHDSYFQNEKNIYRLELSLKNEHLKHIEVYKLNDKEYLKSIYMNFFMKRLQFKKINKKDKNRSRDEEFYLFDINGENCLETKEIIFKEDNILSENKSNTITENNAKSQIRSLEKSYSLAHNKIYLDAIIQTAKDYNLFNYLMRKVKEPTILAAAETAHAETISELDFFNFTINN